MRPHPASAPTLQDAIDQSGSAVNLLWKAGVAPWQPPSVPAEFSGWREEQQAAPEQTVALLEQSHHMLDLFIEGPDATRLLSDTSPNDYEKFDIGQAKQFIAITPQGLMIGGRDPAARGRAEVHVDRPAGRGRIG